MLENLPPPKIRLPSKPLINTMQDVTGPITITNNISSISNSVDLPGSPTTTTQALHDNSTKIATDAFVLNEIASIADTDNFFGTVNFPGDSIVAVGDDYFTLIAGTNISISGNATTHEITIDATVPTGIVVWNEVFGPTAMLVNNGYVANNSSVVTLSLPPTSAFGDILRIVGKGAGGWQITQGAGQIIHFGDQNTTVGAGGSVSSQSTFDIIELLCTTANTNWTELSTQGNLTVI